MTIQELPFFDDITANRHKGNPHSAAANPGNKEAMRTAIVGYARTVKDFTLKEVAAFLGKGLNCISPRISELKAAKDLVPTGETRDRCAVLRLRD